MKIKNNCHSWKRKLNLLKKNRKLHLFSKEKEIVSEKCWKDLKIKSKIPRKPCEFHTFIDRFNFKQKSRIFSSKYFPKFPQISFNSKDRSVRPLDLLFESKTSLTNPRLQVNINDI